MKYKILIGFKIHLFSINGVTSNLWAEKQTITSATVLLLLCEIPRKLEFFNAIISNRHKLPHYVLEVLMKKVKF